MADTSSTENLNPGGFLTTTIPTPLASTAASSIAHPLPTPRQHPLKAGGPKESALIRYLDSGILNAKRRWAKHGATVVEEHDVTGYASFKDAAKDIDGLIDVVWISGTPKLQTVYLLSIALLVLDFIPSFPPAPRTTFSLLEKLDNAFYSLLTGKDMDSGESLPGFENGSGVSTTEKVRLKSIVDRTRIIVVDKMSEGDVEPESPEPEDEERMQVDNEEEDEDPGMDDADDGDGDVEADDEDLWEMSIGRVYERTIEELGKELGGPPIGIITNE